MAFTPKDWREIVVDKISHITSNTPISSVYPGSVLMTLLEATSLEDAEQYFQMLEIIRNYYLDTTTGEDLDKRAAEYGLTRLSAKYATSKVTIGDSEFERISTNIYAGLAGPKAGDLTIYGDASTNFPSSGAIVVGRGSNNVETVNYSSITAYPNYVKFNLSNTLTNDHGTDETLVLAQGGNRIIPAGTAVFVPENDISPQVNFVIDNDVTLLDGENEIEDVTITAADPGSASNVPAGLIINFATPPFSTAIVVNPERVTNGKDEESDEELRDRIKLQIQGLSRGVKAAILSAITGLEDTETSKRVVSANVVESNVVTTPSTCYIDDGTGFEPTYDGTGYEVVITEATGGEKILQLASFPIMKGFVITANSEPYNMSGSLILNILVSTNAETLTFQSSDFDNFAQVTAEEIARWINLRSSLVEARTTDGSKKVMLMAKALANEDITIEGGTANTVFEFPTENRPTLYLYKNYRTLLSKDGSTAAIESGNAESYAFSSGDSILVKIDGKEGYQRLSFLNTDITAELVVERINEQLQGGNAIASSNGTRVSIVSNTLNSTDSKVKIGKNGTITTATTDLIFADTDLSLDFPYIDQIKDLRILITSGTYVGNAQKIQAYNPILGEITLYGSIGGLLSSGDTYVIDGMANGNLGNPANVTNKLNFSVVEKIGSSRDYTLNRFQGQLELTDILATGDIITAGTQFTRGSVTTLNSATFVFSSTATLQVVVDGGTTQTITIPSDTYTAGSLVDLLNISLSGARAEVSNIDDNKVTLRTSTWDPSTGSIQVVGGTAQLILNFPTDLSTNLTPHASYLQCQNSYMLGGETEYSFADISNLIIVIDELVTAPYIITLGYNGTVTTGDGSYPYNNLIDTGLAAAFTSDNFFTDCFIKFKTGANINEMRKVLGYDALSGLLTFDSSFTNAIVIGDTYVLIPRTAKNLANFLSHTTITGLSNRAYVEESNLGQYVTITSKTPGSAGSVNITGGTGNALTISFSSDGTISGTFETNNINGLMIGQKVVIDDDDTAPINGYIRNLSTGSAPYTITVYDARDGGSPLDLTGYTLLSNAFITPKLLPNFSTTISYGIDAYSYYTGLLQKVQWTIDGKEDDEDNYPGVKAAGTQIEVKPPSINRLIVTLDITTVEGISLISIQDQIKAAVANYVNSLGVSKDVILSEIVNKVKQVTGVYDIDILEPTGNVSIGDSELARISESDIIIG